LRGFGVEDCGIFVDKQSGKDFDRPEYRRLLRMLEPGDVLVVKSIDRLGRDYGEILDQWRVITKEKKSAVVVLDMPLLDTRQDERDLTGRLIADLVLQILSYVAQTERESIKQRQAEGIKAAKARGIRFGRPAKPPPEGFDRLARLWGSGKLTTAGLKQRTGLPETTLYRRLRERSDGK
jgi:DNA invertase Pin-like site-specific DNA recombinase